MSDYLIRDFEVSNMRLQEDRDKWRNLCLGLIEIVKDQARVPYYNKSIIERHRKEWPELWNQIDEIANSR